MKKILVTGAAGFIGVNLCQALLDDGNRVYGLDNFYSSSPKNIEHLLVHADFTFIDQDICEPITLSEPINEIYHLACPASPIYYQKDPLYTLDTCYIGTKRALDFAKQKSARILFTSTSEIYGDPLVHPQHEDYFGNVNTLGPRACYDEGKRVAESLMVNYYEEQGVDIRMVRIFNTYGPFMHANDGRVISSFIMHSLNNEAIEIYGDGQQTRSFCYVSDLVRGLMLTMATKAYDGPINLGNNKEITLLELLNEIQSILGVKVPIHHKAKRQDDPMMRQPNIDKAKRLLGWSPEVSLRDGLLKSIDYYKESLQFD